MFNGTGANTSANDNDAFLWTGRVGGTPWSGRLAGHDARWRLGANAFASADTRLAGQPAEFGHDSTPTTPAADNLFTGQRTGAGIDSQLRVGPLELWAEYLRTRFEPASGAEFESRGWYVQAAAFMVPQTLQLVLKYDEFDPRDDRDDDDTRTWTFGTNYLIKGDDLKLQLNYLRSEVPPPLPVQDKVLVRMQLIF